ncbi:endolytic transglycosylase MltG [Micrococcus sp.]|uniref:endolytic transglycosylase MltG n=1 Tax=Micrococcus sp. TaxID=1271 RepID=UPI002A916A85|nr:endolytic transglycosylase MltG [Micrococcus sp.]MDY6055473.1 endolytic transglycosylase MltG [Micrococcus sp.]
MNDAPRNEPHPGALSDDDLDVFGFVDHGEEDPDDDAGPAPYAAAGAAGASAGLFGRRDRRRGSAALSDRARARRRRSVVVISVVAALVVLSLALVVRGLLAGNDFSEAAGDEVTFTVEPGEGLNSVASRLDRQGVIGSAAALRRAAEESGSTVIGAGDFVLREQMPAAEALAVLQGRTRSAVHYVVVNRGQRLDEVLDALVASTGLERAEFERAAQDTAAFGVPASAPNLEGWLDPGEYRIPVEADAHEVLAELVKPRRAGLEAAGVTDPAEQHRVLTVASILEAEALPQDYARVAGIIENRLAEGNTETGGLLQVDATVTYGLGIRGLQFSAAQRQDASNPYNTYQHRGLPPGPIGMPSDAAVEAALHPEPSDDYYWVTTDIGTGHTEFSSTYEEHLGYVREYRNYCASNPGVC